MNLPALTRGRMVSASLREITDSRRQVRRPARPGSHLRHMAHGQNPLPLPHRNCDEARRRRFVGRDAPSPRKASRVPVILLLRTPSRRSRTVSGPRSWRSSAGWLAPPRLSTRSDGRRSRQHRVNDVISPFGLKLTPTPLPAQQRRRREDGGDQRGRPRAALQRRARRRGRHSRSPFSWTRMASLRTCSGLNARLDNDRADRRARRRHGVALPGRSRRCDALRGSREPVADDLLGQGQRHLHGGAGGLADQVMQAHLFA